ncbi:Pentatricopeptide repeat domain family protein [Leishmania donovani]|uniref:Pentatricopeptide repeat domain family protein n=1 Tax=Leishmania donovani TaxID=5661 RepID=A0A504XN70_LEIDO|nr:Pentatricopeptide repeat domain family protein [Leishmania donovani]
MQARLRRCLQCSSGSDVVSLSSAQPPQPSTWSLIRRAPLLLISSGSGVTSVRCYSHEGDCSSSRRTPAAVAPSTAAPSASPDPATTTLGALQRYVHQRDYGGCAAFYEQHFNPAQQHFITDFCQDFVADARDALITLMRVYTNLGRIDKVREVLAVGLRDLAAPKEPKLASPVQYAWLGSSARRRDGGNATAATGTPLKLQDDLLAPGAAARGGRSCDTSAIMWWRRPTVLNADVFNAYFEALTRRNKYAVEEVVFVLDQMKACGVEKDALTYHYLVELHVRAGYDPTGLWEEMKQREPEVTPLPATVQTFMLRVVPYSADPSLVVEITRAALRYGTAIVDKRMLAELMVQWLSPVRAPNHGESSGGSGSRHTAAQASRLGLSTGSPSSAAQYPPEHVLWLMLELELRCVLEKASFSQYVQRHYFTELLLRCAKCTDAGTAEQWMALKGYLDQVDCFRKAQIESLRYTMDRHYLMAFADAINTLALVERALSHLQARRQKGALVTVHTLDLLVLALARIGEERKALQLVSAYEPRWGVAPRTNTYNALLTGCSRHRSTMLHRVVYKTMKNSGVVPNVLTFRVLIRQAVMAGNIDEAIFYLEEVTAYPGLRVEVEMILPILERAARVGDVETATRVSQYSLKCDIGIDGSVLRSVMQQLTEAGQSVEVLKGQLPLHEALRSRSKAGRQRARNEVLV